jgi:hypothetical protein
MAKTSTPSNISEPTVSMIPDSRSTTSVIPIGAGQPPLCITSGPSRSAAISSTTDNAVVAVRAIRATVR